MQKPRATHTPTRSMKRSAVAAPFATAFATVFAIVIGAALTPGLSAQSSTHIGHVADGWGDTPGEVGLLPAAVAEAQVALQHAGLAAGAPSVAAIKTHIGHVLHAVDPEAAEGGGPGSGYGVLKAARGVVQHIGLAAEADDAGGPVRTHAMHVRTAAENVVAWSEEIVAMCDQLMQTEDEDTARELAERIHAATAAIVDGMDADGDGSIGWGEGEGGLAQATTHLGLMQRG